MIAIFGLKVNFDKKESLENPLLKDLFQLLFTESMNLSKSISKKDVSKKIVQVKKPSRMELLKEWRSQKIKQKITADKSKKGLL